VIQTLTSKKHLQEVINIIKEELTQIIKIGLDEDKLSFAKNKIIKSGRLYLQTSEAWVNLHAYRQLNNSNKIWTLEDYIKELEFVDGESIKKTAKVYLKPNKSFLVLCGDIAENEVQL
jgi:predicted Zn-dependent peptidase